MLVIERCITRKLRQKKRKKRNRKRNNLQTTSIKIFNFSQSEHNRINDLMGMTIINNIKDSEMKSHNILANDRKIDEIQMDKILEMLSNVRSRIQDKIDGLKKDYEVDKLPEHMGESSHSLVLRPREFIKTILENYEIQQRNIDEIVEILMIETQPDEEDN